ncbi:BZ3500_MvSof-1268-A1-R1_Chr8-1g09897 [Microbotryum saponariae]|uniref:BZ3500_MvSof-1268-A1-R1_Chr8-1g09897 protein n=1 Tax=Microbotryum saponariae TaxID=289078 RepID=A0A2X0M7R5_9BASI|nr:BZ3500_MvSof-1268-A1-R1_Chr8-1g09897 [Microbotryum saponariae]SDA08183.1 BZ3501_MvSof-1269-A2-R1_Chr8-1g09620 [Microbotryum saponariae]
MVLYELVCISSRQASFAPIRALTTTTTSLVTSNGGVVRSLDHWGTRNLPQRMKRGDGSSLEGVYWTMRFDANPPTVKALNERLRLDPRVLRWTTLKIGEKLHEIARPAAEDPTVRFRRPLPKGLGSGNSPLTQDSSY